ncbi:hypothetical protein [Streptomyces sp. H39-C1]|uniref:hypothetical protein n=1 Tax=Streptomyces sp. H39-C1 TaxID=3004355 RepID=UPI0022AFDE03|nr:hypothetical protein [Streptomyces sp. H39-C1]MCZ4101103.1 hypothetical protein [Streptomyces sp. H39-C1]
MTHRTTRTTSSTNPPEPLSQRWALIFVGAIVVGAVVFVLGGPVAGLGAAGCTVLGLHKVLA